MAIGTAAAIVGGAAIGGIASSIGSSKSSSAVKSAAKTAAAASEAASIRSIELQREMFEQGRDDMAPWREGGAEAFAQLKDKINAGPGRYKEFDYESSPGYQFRQEEGQKAIERSAAARGNLLGGATQKAITRFGQDYATQDYYNQKNEYDKDRSNFFNEYYASLRPLQSLAQVGQTEANLGAQQGQSYASNVGNTLSTNAANQSNAAMASGNAIAANQINQANNISGTINSGINNYMMWKYLNPTTAITGGNSPWE